MVFIIYFWIDVEAVYNKSMFKVKIKISQDNKKLQRGKKEKELRKKFLSKATQSYLKTYLALSYLEAIKAKHKP